MRITMKNFRRHVNSTYEFLDKGMTLLYGPGGAGKSTVLQAIVYGLLGKMPSSIKKYTHGKKNCEVILEYKDIKIIRTKPQIVTVEVDGNIFEGTDAQSIINDRLGMTYNEFIAGAYIARLNQNSVLRMTPSEQLAFIDALTDVSRIAEEKKEEAKSYIKQHDSECIQIQAELKVLEKQREELNEEFASEFPDEESVEMPEDPQEPDKLRAKITALNKRLSIIGTTIKSKNAALKNERAIKERSLTKTKLGETLTTEINQLQRLVNGMTLLTQPQIDTLEADISNYKATIDYYNSYIEYLKSSDDLITAIADFERESAARLAELEGSVLDDDALEELYSKVEAAKEYAVTYEVAKKEYDSILEKKNAAKTVIADIFRKIKTDPSLKQHPYPTNPNTKAGVSPKQLIDYLNGVIAKKKKANRTYIISSLPRHSCPGCGSKLVIYDEEIVIPPETTATQPQLDKINTAIERLESYVESITAAAEDFNRKLPVLGDEPEDCGDVYFSAKRDRDEYDRLLSKEIPPGIKKMKDRLSKLEETFREETPVVRPSDDDPDPEGYTSTKAQRETKLYIKQLSDELAVKISELESHNSTYNDYERYNKLIESKKKILDTLKIDAFDEIKLVELENEISTLTSEMSTITRDINDTKLVLDRYINYERYNELQIKIVEYDLKIAKLKEDEAEILTKLEGYHGLEEAIKEAKILALEKTVNSINEHAKTYLNNFFGENGISVRLVCAKDRGNQGYKLQFNTVIEYKGDRYDHIDELSDSELQRCNVAYLLAVNDKVGADILMLDECFNCTDQEMNTSVMNTIRDMCGEKLILVVSHEIVRGGVYDQIVTIDPRSGEGTLEYEDLQITSADSSGNDPGEDEEN